MKKLKRRKVVYSATSLIYNFIIYYSIYNFITEYNIHNFIHNFIIYNIICCNKYIVHTFLFYYIDNIEDFVQLQPIHSPPSLLRGYH